MDVLLRHFRGPQGLINLINAGLTAFTTIITKLIQKLALDFSEGQIGELYHNPQKYIAEHTAEAESSVSVGGLENTSFQGPAAVNAETDGKSMSGQNAGSAGGGDILGGNETTMARRRRPNMTKSYTRLYYHTFKEHAEVENMVPIGGVPARTNSWSVLPLSSALKKAYTPRDFIADAQHSCGMKVKSASVRYGFSPYIVTTKQTLTQIQTTPNSWFYCVVDNDYLFVGYNLNEAVYDSGYNGIFGHAEMQQWHLGCEPQTSYKTGAAKFEIQPMNVNPFLHPGIQLIKQMEDFNYNWDCSAEVWRHPAMPCLTNHEVSAAQYYFVDNDAGSIGAMEAWMSGMQSNLYSPNLTWGGNIISAPIMDYYVPPPPELANVTDADFVSQPLAYSASSDTTNPA
jgi:hypothetical protein